MSFEEGKSDSCRVQSIRIGLIESGSLNQVLTSESVIKSAKILPF